MRDQERELAAAQTRHAVACADCLLSVADEGSPLEPEDLERLATAAYLLGRGRQRRYLGAGAPRVPEPG